MLITYDYTQDVYYKRGIEVAQKQAQQQIEQEREKAKQEERERAKQRIAEEREKAKQEKIATIQSLLSIGTLSIAQIAEAFDVTEDFVRDISDDMN